MIWLQIIGLGALIHGVCLVNHLTRRDPWCIRMAAVCRAAAGCALFLALPLHAAALFAAAEVCAGVDAVGG